MEITSLIDVCRFENVPKRMTYTHRSLMYTFQPSECLFSQYTESKVLFVSFPSKFNHKVDLHTGRIVGCNHEFQIFLRSQCDFIALYRHVQGRQQRMQNQCRNLNEMYKKEIERYRRLLLSIFIDRNDIFGIDQLLNDINQTILKNHMRLVTQHVNHLETKGMVYRINKFKTII
jgi:hypothetical protein